MRDLTYVFINTGPKVRIRGFLLKQPEHRSDDGSKVNIVKHLSYKEYLHKNVNNNNKNETITLRHHFIARAKFTTNTSFIYIKGTAQ